MPIRKLGVAVAALAVATVPFSAHAAGTQEHDARCAYVKSTILGELIKAEQPDQEVISGVTAHVLYYFGRLEAVLDRPAISDLIIAEALKFESLDEVLAAEEACDATMEGTIAFLGEVSERLSENVR